MTFDAKKYAEELMQAAGVSDDAQKQAIATFFTNENVTKRLAAEQNERMMQSDYNRNMDALRADREKWTDFYKQNLAWKAQEEQKLAQLQQQQQQGYDPNNGYQPNGSQTVLTTDALTAMRTEMEKKFEGALRTQEQQFLGVLEAGLDSGLDYAVRFKEKPDIAAIRKLAVEKQIPLVQAYQEYIAPRVQEMQKADFAAQLKSAREEGAKDALSKHHLPGATAPREFHPLLDRGSNEGEMPPAGPQRERWIRDQFVNDLQTPANATSGG